MELNQQDERDSSEEMNSSSKRGRLENERFDLKKKQRLQQLQQDIEIDTPSRVLHVRNLPSDCTEEELLAIASPFGIVSKVLIVKGKNQGFIEMQDAENASMLLQYYASVPASIRGKSILFQYSNKDSINSPQSEISNNIILATIFDPLYPITVDVLHQVFSKFGVILKIIVFQKPAGLQALIQFRDSKDAATAKIALDGQNIYSGCCTLKLQFSSLTSLNVKFNNDKTRDFTNPSLPSGQGVSNVSNFPYILNPLGLTLANSAFPPVDNWNNFYPNAQPTRGNRDLSQSSSVGISQLDNGPTVVIVSNLDNKVEPDHLFTLFGVYGDVLRVKILFNKQDTALIQYVNSQQCQLAIENLNMCPLFGKQIGVNISKHNTVALPKPGSEAESNRYTQDYAGSPLHRFRVANSKNYQHICRPSVVLHVSNIHRSGTEEKLVQLFSQYGKVVAFKFFPKDKKMALIEMDSLDSAVSALVHLHNYRIADAESGTNIRVSFTGRKIINSFDD